jgi:hypothetical protein
MAADLPIYIKLLAKDLASKTIGNVSKEVSTLGKVTAHAQRGVRNLGTNLAKLGAVAAVGIGAAVKSGIDELVTLENANSATAGALKASGLAASVTALQVRELAESLEAANDAYVDDKDIQAASNTLIRFGNISADQLGQATQIAIDLGVQMGDTAGAATALARSLADPTKATRVLRQAGISLTKEEQKKIKALWESGKTAEAQGIILDKLSKKTENAARSAGGPYADSLNKLRDVTEDAKKALAEGFLPVITKVADLLSKELAKPGTMANIREFGQTLAKGLDSLVEIARNLPWDQIGQSLKIAGAGAKAVLGAFNSMPPWVQTAILTGWGLDRLTGGALGGIVKELAGGLIKGVLGMNAAVVNLTAGAVNGLPGAGGAVGKVGGAAGKIGAIASGVMKVAVVGMAAGVAVALAGELANQSGQIREQAKGVRQTAQKWAPTATEEDLVAGIRSIDDKFGDFPSNLALTITNPLNGAKNELKATRADLVSQLNALRTANAAGDERITSRIGSLNATLAAKNFSPTVNVSTGFTIVTNVSVRDTVTAITKREAYNRVKGGTTRVPL